MSMLSFVEQFANSSGLQFMFLTGHDMTGILQMNWRSWVLSSVLTKLLALEGIINYTQYSFIRRRWCAKRIFIIMGVKSDLIGSSS